MAPHGGSSQAMTKTRKYLHNLDVRGCGRVRIHSNFLTPRLDSTRSSYSLPCGLRAWGLRGQHFYVLFLSCGLSLTCGEESCGDQGSHGSSGHLENYDFRRIPFKSMSHITETNDKGTSEEGAKKEDEERGRREEERGEGERKYRGKERGRERGRRGK